MPTLMTTLQYVSSLYATMGQSKYLFFSSLLASKGCAPLDGPAAGVGVEDDEALEDMDGCTMDMWRGYYERDEGDEGNRLRPSRASGV